MKSYFTLLVFLLLFNIIDILYIYIDPREKKCLTEYRLANSSYDLIYYVSGQEEENNIATIEDNNGNIISKVMNKKNNRLSHRVQQDGELKFCFENLASSKVTLSFVFDYGTNEYSAISIKTIENFVTVVDNLEKKLKQLQFNIRNSAVRKKAHFNI